MDDLTMITTQHRPVVTITVNHVAHVVDAGTAIGPADICALAHVDADTHYVWWATVDGRDIRIEGTFLPGDGARLFTAFRYERHTHD